MWLLLEIMSFLIINTTGNKRKSNPLREHYHRLQQRIQSRAKTWSTRVNRLSITGQSNWETGVEDYILDRTPVHPRTWQSLVLMWRSLNCWRKRVKSTEAPHRSQTLNQNIMTNKHNIWYSTFNSSFVCLVLFNEVTNVFKKALEELFISHSVDLIRFSGNIWPSIKGRIELNFHMFEIKGVIIRSGCSASVHTR